MRFKNTFVGQIPVDWETASLGQICDLFKEGIDPSAFPDELFEYYSIPAFQETGQPTITPGRDILSQKLTVKDGTVLFGKLNPRVPKVWCVRARTPYRAIASTEFIPLFPRNGLDAGFLTFLCWSPYVMGVAKGLVSGSTPSRQRVAPSSFSEIEVPVPPLPEQRAIAAVLSKIQAAVEVQDKIVATLKELKAATMARLFREGLRGEPLKQTEIGEIPESWEVVFLRSLLREPLRNGHSASVSPDGDGVRTLTLTAVTQRDFSLANTKMTSADPSRVQDLWLSDSDVFVERANTAEMVGLAALYRGPANFAIFPDLLIRVRVQPELLLPDVLVEWLLLPWCRTYFQKHCRGAATSMPKIDHQTVESVFIPIPPMDEQQMIARTIRTLDSRISAASLRANVLKSLFSSMLHLLVTGRVRVTPRMVALQTVADWERKRKRTVGKVDEKMIEEIVRQIVGLVSPEKIILFGSAAKGEMGPGSDLDFLVIKSCENRREAARTIYKNLKRAGIPIDIVVATPQDIERYKDTIGLIYRPALREGKVVYAA